MNYRDEMTRAMTMLGHDPHTIFMGQSVRYPGTAMFGTLKDVPDDKKIELPVAEELQMGQSIGLSLAGFIPISLFPRMDFLLCCMNQLVNVLDKTEQMSEERFKPKVIIRTSVGGKKQLDPGPQHCGDYHNELRTMCKNIDVYYLDSADIIYFSYQTALDSPRSSILIELGDMYE